jgi:predicted transcriptional regulator
VKVLLSIKPPFVEEIFKGTKKFEYRKCIFTNKDVEAIVIYATKPIGKLVGEFTIERILKKHPDELWEETKDFAGVSKEFYDQYFSGRDQAFAIKIGILKKYAEPIDPYKKFINFHAPQSFKYIV